MSKESSHQEDTTTNTYIDLGADTAEGYLISSKSRSIARRALGNGSVEDRIRQRCSIAVGDFEMSKLIVFKNDPVKAGLDSLERSATIYSDIRMVQVGIQKKGGSGSSVECFLDYGGKLAKEKGITRTSAGVLALGDRLNGSIAVIGNAPSCLISLCKLLDEGVRPGLIIGCPVGFVNAAESKELLRRHDIPSISTVGTRGGTPVAVAAMNELITIFHEAHAK